jgi:hypothetical protein
LLKCYCLHKFYSFYYIILSRCGKNKEMVLSGVHSKGGRMSLKKEVEARIRKTGRLTYDELVNLCWMRGQKISNAERRLRELCNETDIEPVRTNKGAISRWQVEQGQKVMF